MSNQAWVEPFVVSGEDGTALASSTSATSILPASRKFTLPSYYFDNPGKTLRIRAAGRISTTGTPTITLDLRFGSVVVFNGGAITTGSGITNLTWIMDVELSARTIGASTSATMFGIGELKGVVTAVSCNMLPASAPAAGTGFDSTAAQTIDLFATWSASSASNTITCHQFRVLALN